MHLLRVRTAFCPLVRSKRAVGRRWENQTDVRSVSCNRLYNVNKQRQDDKTHVKRRPPRVNQDRWTFDDDAGEGRKRQVDGRLPLKSADRLKQAYQTLWQFHQPKEKLRHNLEVIMESYEKQKTMGKKREIQSKGLAREIKRRRKDSERLRDEANKRTEREWRWLREHIDELCAKDGVTKEERGAAFEAKLMEEFVQRIVTQQEPLAYVIGHQPFGPLRIRCKAPTLIPRTETEALTEHVAERVGDVVTELAKLAKDELLEIRILDMCCGTGCIALLLRHLLAQKLSFENVRVHIVAADNAPTAIDLSRENLAQVDAEYATAKETATGEEEEALHKGLERIQLKVESCDLFDNEQVESLLERKGPFHLVICNPPYIPLSEWQTLDASVKGWEDRHALVGDVKERMEKEEGQGLDFYVRLSQLIRRYPHQLLAHRSEEIHLPLVAVEVGHDQAKIVKTVLWGSKELKVLDEWIDPFGVPRGVLALKLPEPTPEALPL